MARKLPFVVACFLAIYLIWGSTYLAVVLGLESIPPLMLMGIRSVAGGIILLTLGWRGIAAVSVWAWASAAACGLLFFLGCHGILAYAQQTQRLCWRRCRSGSFFLNVSCRERNALRRGGCWRFCRASPAWP